MNLINGARQAVDNLLDHKDIVGVSFVGSTPVAKYVYRRAAENGKRVQAQGGAKNVLVVMPDANYEKAIPNILGSCFGSAGQRCLAGSLIVAVDDAYDEVKHRLVEAAQSMKIGDGAEQGVDLGPVVSKEAKERVVGYIDVGEREGANLVLDGRKVEGDADPEGFFVGPTIFDGVTTDMKIASDEIFGPVVGVIRANDLDGAPRSDSEQRLRQCRDHLHRVRQVGARVPLPRAGRKRWYQRGRGGADGVLPLRWPRLIVLWIAPRPGTRRSRLFYRSKGGNHPLAVSREFRERLLSISIVLGVRRGC